jgi:hypothetical protein
MIVLSIAQLEEPSLSGTAHDDPVEALTRECGCPCSTMLGRFTVKLIYCGW